MPADIVIRGGTVFDGSGAPGRAADVAIAGGVIREIGPKLAGQRASWTRRAAPSRPASSTSTPTTTRRCSGIRRSGRRRLTASPPWWRATAASRSRPTRPEHHDVIVRTLENVEDMDPATLAAGIRWEFETFPQYLELVRRRGTVLNFTAYIGHSALRLYVMGDAAYERAATADEIERMCELVREAIDAGAAGFSTSFSFAHRGVDGKPVPSRFAARDEVEALFFDGGRGGQGRGARHAGRAVQLCRLLRAAAAHRPAVHLAAVRGPGRRAPPAAQAARGEPVARRCRSGRRSRRGRSPCSSRWRTRTASTSARCSGSC